MNTKVLIFGANGFIGKHLVWQFEQDERYNVVAADISPMDFSIAKTHPCNILNTAQIETLFATVKPEYVYNLAGFASLDQSIHNPPKVVELNVMGNLHILEACRKHAVKRFVYASSAYSVGDAGGFYGFSKAHSEKLVELYQQHFGLDFTILRYGSIYGATPSDNNYLYNLIKQALETGRIEHDSDGEEVREYIHVDDVARLSIDILDNTSYINQHLILTGQERLSRRELFMMINEILGNRLQISFTEGPVQGRYRLTPYNLKAERCSKLTANPFIDLGQGLLDCIQRIEQDMKQ